MEKGASQAVAADLSAAMMTGSEAFAGAEVGRVDRRAPAVSASVLRHRGLRLALGHVRDLADALEAIAFVLRPGGQLLVSASHPYATLRGWERTFVDSGRGETYAIEQHLHMFSDTSQGLGRVGLTLEALEEARWQGSPVVFVLRARKAGRLGEESCMRIGLRSTEGMRNGTSRSCQKRSK